MIRFAQRGVIALAIATALSVTMSTPALADISMEDANRFVKMCDGNKDGMVSKTELMAHVQKMMKDLPTDKAGMVDEKKALAFLFELQRGDGGTAAPVMISKEMLMKKVLTAFEKMDADKRQMLDAKRTMQLLAELMKAGG